MFFLKMPTRSLKRKLAQNWISNILVGVTTHKKWTLSSHLVKTMILPLLITMLSTLKKVLMLTWQNCTRKKERPLQSTWPSLHQRNTVNGKIYAVPVAANVASSQNFAFNGPLLEKYGIDVSNVKDYASLEPVLKAIKEKDPNVVPFAMNRATVDLQMTSTMWLLMDFHSLLTWKVTLLRSLTVTPFLVM